MKTLQEFNFKKKKAKILSKIWTITARRVVTIMMELSLRLDTMIVYQPTEVSTGLQL